MTRQIPQRPESGRSLSRDRSVAGGAYARADGPESVSRLFRVDVKMAGVPTFRATVHCESVRVARQHLLSIYPAAELSITSCRRAAAESGEGEDDDEQDEPRRPEQGPW